MDLFTGQAIQSQTPLVRHNNLRPIETGTRDGLCAGGRLPRVRGYVRGRRLYVAGAQGRVRVSVRETWTSGTSGQLDIRQ